MKNIFEINTQERLRILEMHINATKNQYLITEANETDEFIVTGQNFFENGKYSNFSKDFKKDLDSQLQKAAEFIVKNKGSVVYVKIIAGESQVTNYDKEKNPPEPVEPLYLSKRRAETMKLYLEKYFKSLKDNGTISSMPIFEAPETKIGPTKYDKNKDKPNDPKYDTERFVTVELKIKPAYECIVGLTVEVRYVKEIGGSGHDGKPLKCRGGHQCDKAKFNVKLNGVVIGVADLKNGKDGASKSSGPIQVTDALAKQIIGDKSKNIIITLQCISGEKCHSSTPEVEIKKGDTVIFHQCAPAISTYGDQKEMKILELDNCGNLIQMSTADATNKSEGKPAEGKPEGQRFNVSAAIKLPIGIGWDEKSTSDYHISKGNIQYAITQDNKKYYQGLKNFQHIGKPYAKGNFYYFA
jgi:hypothetical protein